MDRFVKQPEILAPVGGREQLEAAVKSGADAVYFGAPDFNARRNAENFTPEAFADAVKYCRVRGVKTYITLNTLITDRELPAFAETLALVAKSGADAVIVQDLAAARMIKEYYPFLALHASTQMAVHNVSGAKLLREFGFRRIVLARELSLKEIRAVKEATDLEIEVFVHGAHCMSFSGLCYMSCVFGGRSANRGLCAQPCRLNFKNDRREYALSLKDMSLIGHLEELRETGVCSLKIEGRMKRPEYVAAAVNACRTRLAGETPDTETLRSVFSRGGFTDGYLIGKINGEMFGHRTKEDVTAAAPVLGSLRRLYDKEFKRVPVTMDFTAAAGEPVSLSVSDGAHTACAAGPVPETARTAPLTAEKAAASLTKLGDTPYYCESPVSRISAGLMVPASALNALRRDAVTKLDALRAAFDPPADRTETILSAVSALPYTPPSGAPALRLRFSNAAQFFRLPGCERYILPMEALLKNEALLSETPEAFAAEVPVLLFPAEEEKALAGLTALKALGVRYAVAENIGAIRLIKTAGLTPVGGAHLNITNRLALAAYEVLGCTDNTLSFELHFAELEKLRGSGKTGCRAYGHLPLMRFRSCPQRTSQGCGDCRGGATLTDRKNETFRLLCSGRRYATLYNPVPLYTGTMEMPAADFRTLYFTYENKDLCREIARRFLAGEKLSSPVTAGLYNKRLL